MRPPTAKLWRHIDFKAGGRRVGNLFPASVLMMRHSLRNVKIDCTPNVDEISESTAEILTIYRVAQTIGTILYALTLPNINQFSKLFYRQNQEKICNTITKDPTIRQVCRYTTL